VRIKEIYGLQGQKFVVNLECLKLFSGRSGHFCLETEMSFKKWNLIISFLFFKSIYFLGIDFNGY